MLQSHKNKPLTVSVADLIQLQKSAHSIHFSYKRQMLDSLSGHSACSLRSRGMDFSEVRHYQWGDDVRSIDWRVTARTGKPYTKVFCEERDRTVFFVIDYRPAMFFGTRVTFKSVIAAKAAALLAWAAIEEGNRVGAFVCSAHQCVELRPRARRHGVLPLLKVLANPMQMFGEQTSTKSSRHLDRHFKDDISGMTVALTHLKRVAHPGSLIVLLSDFRGIGQETEPVVSQLSQHSEIMMGFISDPFEQFPPPPNQYVVADGEKKLMIDTAQASVCAAYSASFQQRYQHVLQMVKKYRLSYFELYTNSDVVESLSKQLSNKH